MASRWLDVMMGEVASKRDAVEEREIRRSGIQSCVREQFERLVKPAMNALSDSARSQGTELWLEQSEEGERDSMTLRLTARGDELHPLRPFLEFAAEPYHPVIIARLRRVGQSRPERLGLFTLDELDEKTVSNCLKSFAELLNVPMPSGD